jgi:hypothetical protein
MSDYRDDYNVRNVGLWLLLTNKQQEEKGYWGLNILFPEKYGLPLERNRDTNENKDSLIDIYEYFAIVSFSW